MRIRCPHDRLVPIAELKLHPKNRNSHPKDQIERLAKILAYQGWRYPVKVSLLSGYVTSGHGRIEAAVKNGWDEVPVSFQEYENEDQEYADLTADNAIASWSELDLSGINFDLASLGPELDLDMLGLKGFEMNASDREGGGQEHAQLSDRFLVAPFSVLNAREGWWQDRKRKWLAMGIQSELGRDGELLGNQSREGFGGDYDLSKGESAWGGSGTSIFDPVLCELLYRWFSPQGGIVLDPFAGGSVRGVVASKLGRQYVGCELRQEQVSANRAQAAEICQEPQPAWACGDSRMIQEHCRGVEADFLFSCPPYADLEVYSDDERDLSNMPYERFRELYAEIIANSAAMLRPNRFAAFVVGEVRSGQGGGRYHGFVPDTIRAFEQAGLSFYNEAILITPCGSLPLRAGRPFELSRKLGKTHQNILIFVKGDPTAAAQACGQVEVTWPEASQAED